MEQQIDKVELVNKLADDIVAKRKFQLQLPRLRLLRK